MKSKCLGLIHLNKNEYVIFCALFNNNFSISACTISNDYKKIRRDVNKCSHGSRHYPSIYLMGLRNSMKTSVRGLTWPRFKGPFVKYKSQVLTACANFLNNMSS
jgi:hypothetical protein